MSRSNPATNPNPTVRWFEWNGDGDPASHGGTVRFYDKEAKKNVDVALPFTFLWLDELGVITGWHEPSGSSITSNEVRDTRQEVFVVRSFKGGELAVGLYGAIKDRVSVVGGSYTSSCYIAFRDDKGQLALGNIQFKGIALKAWMDFRKANRQAIHEKAVNIVSYEEGRKGKIVFRSPVFALKDVSAATNTEANLLDNALQEYLKTYLSRPRTEQVQNAVEAPNPNQQHQQLHGNPPPRDVHRAPIDDFNDEVPF